MVIADTFVGTFAFLPNAQSQNEKCKRANKPTHQDSADMIGQSNERQNHSG
ncbi:MAG: hypothetical protein Q7U77_05440 [Sediminibacterium sp.]|uniref:hypothetical protein n=1 Tax=Sediminibacterium sp. TaxID=1917865 RepID=UPI0027188C13|nr:hypothetical protein [Sediminibacterium sp.]MDO8996049.1 hypothetical protein [Sediminibacterium sp.]